MVVRELRALDADVVGVQEASRGRRRGDIAARLASALGFHHVYAPAAHRWPFVSRVLGLEEGPAVLSRFPIATSHVHPIDGCGGLYRRMLVCAELATPRGALEACSTHLDGSDCHAERVANILGARPRTAPLLLMGDLNATEQSKGIRNLIAALGLVDTFREARRAGLHGLAARVARASIRVAARGLHPARPRREHPRPRRREPRRPQPAEPHAGPGALAIGPLRGAVGGGDSAQSTRLATAPISPTASVRASLPRK